MLSLLLTALVLVLAASSMSSLGPAGMGMQIPLTVDGETLNFARSQ